MAYKKPISISLSPNVQKDDVALAWDVIIRPWFWKKGKAIGELESEFKKYIGAEHAFSFNSGRSSFYAILKALNLPMGSEVLLQAFTCNAVPNPVLWANLTPVYVDCDAKTYNIDMNDLAAKITPNAKVLVVQHTFGLAANMDEIMAFCEKHHLILIEDCAHALGAEWNNQKVGTFGRAAFFSFSRDKVISSVYGGMAVTSDPAMAHNLRHEQTAFGMPSQFWIKQQLSHPILLSSVILPLYHILDIGKAFLVLSQALHVLSKAVHWKEKRGEKPDYFPKALPNALAILALHQFGKLTKLHAHRKRMFSFYYEQLQGTDYELPVLDNQLQSYLRFTVQHPQAHEILYEAWHKQNMLLGDWYTTAIAPFDTRLETMKYEKGSCRTAELLATRTLNLPTHINISEKDAQRIIVFLKKYGKRN